jgi:hypothetical protein
MERQPPFQKGDRIRLLAMPEDPDPVPVGSLGTVERVTDLWGKWQVDVRWDEVMTEQGPRRRSLGLVIPPDVAVHI